jgi:predicted Zn-dependent protease
VQVQLKKTKNTTKRFFYSIVGVLAVLLLLITTAVLSKDWMVRKVAEKVPPSWEKKAGDQLFALIQSDQQLVEMDSLKTVFLQVAKPLLAESRKKGVEVEVYFSKDPTINAFALPGGKVVIQYGLIENAKSWEEVMGVMGHELAHVTERHHVRSIINSLGMYAVLSAMIGDVSAIAGTIASSGSDLASLSNSRKFETEADEQGLKFLMQANINPKGLISFFHTLEKEHEKSAIDNLSFLSTHPGTKERIAHLEKLLSKTKGVYAPLPSNFLSFQKSFKQKI